MKVFSKFLISVFLIIFVLFFAWPISDEVSWSLTRSFWADRSRVDAGAALIGASFGALLYHASVVSSCAHCAGKPLTKRCHFCFKEPLMKSCPFCAEEVKYAAIKCKHCYSDISESESD